MNSVTGFPPITLYDITNITNDIAGKVTVSSVAEPYAFYLVNGMTITINGVVGMYQVNRQRFTIANLDTVAMTFEIYDNFFNPVDTSGYAPYIAGGQINIISYPPQAGSPPGLMYNTQPITI